MLNDEKSAGEAPAIYHRVGKAVYLGKALICDATSDATAELIVAALTKEAGD